jgi:RimJ/RimL family protein N-acetyltransferase
VSGVRLETERLVLRLPRLEDAPAAAEYLGDPEAMRFLGGETVPPEEAPAVVAKWMQRWELDDVGPFVLERREDGRFVGRSGILVWDRRKWTQSTFAEAGEHAQPELGWTLVRRYWGNGYATEAARAARDWARAERGLTRLISLVNPANVASQRVAERLGAQRTDRVTLFDSGPADVWLHPEA